MKIYMAGVGGMLGEAFYNEFKENNELKCSDINPTDDWQSEIDFRNAELYSSDVREFKPDWLFHIGAHTDLEYCETNPDDAYATNSASVETAVELANELSIPIFYVSTAGIFSGNKEYFDESDQPNPLGHYAKSKYKGERFIIENSHEYLICRAGWMMGGGIKKDKKFVSKIIKQILKGAKELYIVDDKDGTPTYTKDFSKNVNHLIKNNKRGLYNMVCSGMTSRIEVGKKILDIFNLTNKIKIVPVSSSFFSDTYFAERPDNERLISKRLDNEGMNVMQTWEDALENYLHERFIPLSNDE